METFTHKQDFAKDYGLKEYKVVSTKHHYYVYQTCASNARFEVEQLGCAVQSVEPV